MAPSRRSQPTQSAKKAPSNSAAVENSRATPSRYVNSGVLTLYVGKKRKKLEIHKDLLRDKSQYFEAMLSEGSQWEEARANEVHWDDEGEGITLESVDIWVNWLYGKTLDGQRTNTLLQCYKLADKRLMPEFKKDVTQAIEKFYGGSNGACGPDIIVAGRELGLQQTDLYERLFRSMIRSMLKLPGLWIGTLGTERKAALNESLKDTELAQQIFEAMMKFQDCPWVDPFSSDQLSNRAYDTELEFESDSE